VDGGELFDVIQNPKWGTIVGGAKAAGEVLVRRIFTELARATGFLHACGVVHRDIKLESEY
jgi:serine/threonine protein kinase